MKEIKISVETLNVILGYLGTRPYQEVFNLVKLIQDTAAESEKQDEPTFE
jgi:hypothetical protein